MGIVVVAVGQCGIQLLSSLSTLLSDATRYGASCSAVSALVDERTGRLRCVLVDGEPKVVTTCVNAHARTRQARAWIHADSSVWGHAGCGSCFAIGFHHRIDLVDAAVVEIRRELDRHRSGGEDAPTVVWLLMSSGGGSGSGLGARIIHTLRNTPGEESALTIMAFCVLPFRSNGGPLRHLNTCLSLMYMVDVADCIVVSHNEQTEQYLQTANATRNHSSQAFVDLLQMNVYIVSGLLNLLLLTAVPSFQLGTFLEDMCPSRSKFVELITTLNGVPSSDVHAADGSTTSWLALAGALAANISKYETDNKAPARLAAGLIIVRGRNAADFAVELDQVKRVVARSCPGLTSFLIEPSATRRSNREPSSLTAVLNRSTIAGELQWVLDRAKSKFEAGAFVHVFERNGCDRDSLRAAFITMDVIIKDMRSLTSQGKSKGRPINRR